MIRRKPLLWLALCAIAIAAALLALRCRSQGGTKHAKSPAATKHLAVKRPTASSIAGTVTDEKRAPVTGARVCADDVRADSYLEPHCTDTDARGGFTLRNLTAGEYEVSALAKSYRAATSPRFALAQDEHKTGVDLQLRARGVEIDGIVSDITGGPISHAFVREAHGPAVETDAQGRFTLWTRPGFVDLTAFADGYSGTVKKVWAPGYVAIQLAPESSISGIVVDAASGKPVADVTVEARLERDTVRRAVSDEDGRFELTKLAADRYQLVARGDTGYGQTEGSVFVGLGQRVENVAIKLFRAYRVVGTVVLPSGVACTTARLALDSDAHLFEGHADLDGTLHVAGVVPGRYRVLVTCPGFAARDTYPDIEVVDRDIVGQQWPVDAGATLQGTVRLRSGAALEDAHVTIATPVGLAEAWTEADGHYVITGILPGDVTVTVETDDAVTDDAEVTLAPGRVTTHDFVLDPGGRLRGTVVDATGQPVPDFALELTASDEEVEGASTNDRGEFEVAGLRPSTYTITPRTADEKEVRPGESVTVQVRPGAVATARLVIAARQGTIHGQVFDRNGKPVSDAYVAAVATASDEDFALAKALYERPAVLTEADGTFELHGLPAQPHDVFAFRMGGGEAVTRNVPIGGRAVLRLRQTGSIEGHVTVDHAPADDFSIRLVSVASSREEHFLHTGGGFAIRDLADGEYGLTVLVGGMQIESHLVLAEGEKKIAVSFDLQGTALLSGRFVDQRHHPVPAVRVWADSAQQHGSERLSSVDGRFVVPAPRSDIVLRFLADEHERNRRYSLAGQRSLDVGDIVIEPVRDDEPREDDPQAP